MNGMLRDTNDREREKQNGREARGKKEKECQDRTRSQWALPRRFILDPEVTCTKNSRQLAFNSSRHGKTNRLLSFSFSRLLLFVFII